MAEIETSESPKFETSEEPRISTAVQDFLDGLGPDVLIGGRLVPAGGAKLQIFNPATEELLVELADAEDSVVDAAVAAARQALASASWRDLSPRRRGRLLFDIADAIAAEADFFAELEAIDNGKPIGDARAVDVDKTIEWFEYFAGWPSKLEGTTIPAPPGNRLVYTLRQPIGVVGQIIPWNYPLMMAAWKLAPALASGCAVVLKPAEQTPLSAIYLVRLMESVGLPAGVVNVLTGRGETTGVALVEHPGLDKLAFTGSTEVGREIMHRSAQHVRPLTFELGGNSANLVLADVDTREVAGQLASAAWANQGQNCCAGTRLLVARERHDSLIEDLQREAAATVVGPGLDPATQLGPLVSDVQRDRVLALIESGRAAGADIAVGGGVPAGRERGYFVEPTVIASVEDKAEVVRDEIFGPVITVLPFSSIEEAAVRANATAYGLAAGIWTHDVDAAHALAGRLRAGTVWINTYNETSPAVPFGGFGDSGFGREHGHAVLEHYSVNKSVWVGDKGPAGAFSTTEAGDEK